jgi:coenzyme F420 hydrogenase subunit beta
MNPMSEEKKIIHDLIKDVVQTDLCVSCGTCVAVCPVGVIELRNGVPELIGDCIECGLCYSNCPRTDFNIDDMDNRVFNRERSAKEEIVGIYSQVYKARSKVPEINERAQDGGVVSSILSSFLSEGGDGVIVAGLDETKTWVPKPIVGKNNEDIIDAAGTKYTSSPTLLGVKEAVKDQKLVDIAVVGTPCQIRGLSKLTEGKFRNKKYSDAVKLKIGLFCMETFRYDDWIRYLENNNVNPEKVTKFEIKNGRFYANKDDEVIHKTRLKNVKKLVRPCCHHCDDFTCEYSDISIGNVGSPEGWSTVIVRNEKGEKALKEAENADLIEIESFEDFDEGESLVHRLANMKKK